MAKRSQMTRERYVNRYRDTIVFGADASTAVFDVIETGMNIGQSDPTKWTILGFDVMPAGVGHDPYDPGTGTWAFRSQLLIGEQAAVLGADDQQCIANVQCSSSLLTSGKNWMHWPLVAYLPYPLPVFAKELTVAIHGTNDAELNSKQWTYEIWYVTGAVSPNEIVEYLAAYGQV